MSVFAPGGLVRARERVWVIEAVEGEVLRLRTLGISSGYTSLLHTGLEPVAPAPPVLPRADVFASQSSACLLRDALALSLRRGAGPFRSLGHLAFTPFAYQIVPLMMALGLDPVRLLIADDVGLGKTLEAGLIARELLDRGEVDSFTVLVPPHLVEPWVGQLQRRFSLDVTAVTAQTATRLEAALTPGQSIFRRHPFTVVSIDFVKSERRRDDFVQHAPQCVIVDEAHACVGGGGGHQRFLLMQRLVAQHSRRHLVLCTATPHTGDSRSFGRLISLLHPDFAAAAALTREDIAAKLPRLRQHVVQRRRPDLAEWTDDSRIFPRREVAAEPYGMTRATRKFFSDFLAYCARRIAAAESPAQRQRLFWGSMTMLSCAASSPRAAAAMLEKHAATRRAAGDRGAAKEDVDDAEARAYDDDSLGSDDAVPTPLPATADVSDLLAQARTIDGKGPARDYKLLALFKHVSALLAADFNPVIFCHFVPTARYVATHLAKYLAHAVPSAGLRCVVGEDGDGPVRAAKVKELVPYTPRVLVATDCLSEGSDLQSCFDAVVHYDLSFNPMRLQQREGRVDRLGQPKQVVRALLLHGPDHPVDLAVLDILRAKDSEILDTLGLSVPLPLRQDELGPALLGELLRGGAAGMAAVLARAAEARAPIGLADASYRVVDEGAGPARHLAGSGLRPEAVLPEWRRALATLGDVAAVEHFVLGALARLGAPAQPRGAHRYRADLDALPGFVRQRLVNVGLKGRLAITFAAAGEPDDEAIGRGHPLVTMLGEALLNASLAARDVADARGALGQVGCWETDAVTRQTTVALLRLRHRLRLGDADAATQVVDEAGAVAWERSAAGLCAHGAPALALLSRPAIRDLPRIRRARVDRALIDLEVRLPAIEHYASERADSLRADHERLRTAAGQRTAVEVHALLPVDVLGCFVLVPPAG